MQDYIVADWPAPPHVRAFTTLRTGGVSAPPYASWNMASHVDDKPVHVDKNRALLRQRLTLPNEPIWLEQVHGTKMWVDEASVNSEGQADGSYTRSRRRVCAVMTADCLPVLLCNRAGTEVAAVHAGWKGLADGIIEAALPCFQSPAEDILVWLGPAIGPQAFEVGEDVREIFLQKTAKASEAFTPRGSNKYLANLYLLARQRLQMAGVQAVYGGQHCTFTQAAQFYSYRRDGVTGRMASIIWIE